MSLVITAKLFSNDWFEVPFFFIPGLTWNIIFEQTTTWVLPVFSYLFMLRQLLTIPIIGDKQKEQRLLFSGIIFVFLIGLSTGTHAAAQIIEHVIIAPEFAEFARSHPQMLDLIFVLDEIVGHLSFAFGTVVMYLLCMLELDRKRLPLTRLDKIILLIISSFCGILWSYAYLEGGSMQVLVLPLAIYLLIKLEKEREDEASLFSYPLNFYFLCSTIVLAIITLVWAMKFGLFVQPSATVFKL